jgi:hypothetical protein
MLSDFADLIFLSITFGCLVMAAIETHRVKHGIREAHREERALVDRCLAQVRRLRRELAA